MHYCFFLRNACSCYLQEILATLIMLSEDAEWSEKCGLLFELFKGVGSSQVSYEDVMLMAQVLGTALSRLWAKDRWDQAELYSLSEGLADNLYNKVGW